MTVDTVAELVRRWERIASPGTRRTWGPYMRTLTAELGHLPATDVRISQLRALVQDARTAALASPRHRTGASAAEHMTAACRAIFRLAVEDRVLGAMDNPAGGLRKVKRPEPRRRALTAGQVAELWTTAASGGLDPELDLLILRAHLELGARRDGLLGLKYEHLLPQTQVIRLHEKGGSVRDQPCSATLMSALLRHTRTRTREGETITAGSPVLRYRNGRPITRRRYESLFGRLRRDLPWAAELGLSSHWLRHTAITSVERLSSHAVAARFAGHAQSTVTDTYTRATDAEVARVVAILTGEPHPLAS